MAARKTDRMSVLSASLDMDVGCRERGRAAAGQDQGEAGSGRGQDQGEEGETSSGAAVTPLTAP